MGPVIHCGEDGEQYVPAERGWRTVFVDRSANLITYQVIFWRFYTGMRRGRSVALISPMACVNDSVEESTEIQDASEFDAYLGVIGPDEDIERFRKMAVEAATAVFGTSPIELLAATGQEQKE